MSELSKRIKRLMAERQLTVNMLVQRCSISRTHLYNILADRVNSNSVSLGMLEEIARGLSVNLVELLHDPRLKDLEGLRQLLSDEDIGIVENFESLCLDDWRRKAILDMLRIKPRKDPRPDIDDKNPIDD